MAFTLITWICLRFITSDKIHLAKNSERGKMTRQTEEKEGRQHQGMDRPGVRQVPERSGEQKGKKRRKKMEETGYDVILWCPNDPRG